MQSQRRHHQCRTEEIAHDFSSDFKANISDTFRIFAELVPGRKVFKEPAKVPIEFTMIALLVFVHKDTLANDQLSDVIANWDVKAAYVDTGTGMAVYEDDD